MPNVGKWSVIFLNKKEPECNRFGVLMKDTYGFEYKVGYSPKRKEISVKRAALVFEETIKVSLA